MSRFSSWMQIKFEISAPLGSILFCYLSQAVDSSVFHSVRELWRREPRRNVCSPLFSEPQRDGHKVFACVASRVPTNAQLVDCFIINIWNTFWREKNRKPGGWLDLWSAEPRMFFLNSTRTCVHSMVASNWRSLERESLRATDHKLTLFNIKFIMTFQSSHSKCGNIRQKLKITPLGMCMCLMYRHRAPHWRQRTIFAENSRCRRTFPDFIKQGNDKWRRKTGNLQWEVGLEVMNVKSR